MKSKHFTLKNFFFFLFISSYIFGFFLRENIAGGAETDFLNFTWPLIISFKENFNFTLKNYGSFGEGSLPLFHIINAYLNPLSFNQFFFQGSITLISILNVIIFSQIIEKKFQLKKKDALLYSCIFLILPFFRSSAFWGITENFGWLFLLISIKYYNILEQKKSKHKQIDIFLTCLFSSLALYIRPYLVFFPVFFILKTLIYREYSLLKSSVIFYLILSIPGIYLIYIWGGIFKIGESEINLLKDYHNPKFIIKNLIIFSSLFFFYSLPFEFLKKNYLNKKVIFVFSCVFIFLLFINYFEIFNYLNLIKIGGGIFLKINKFLFGENLIFFLAISALGILVIYNYSLISKKNNIILISLIIFCFPKYILQEYFEPLILIILFGLIDLGKVDLKKLKKKDTVLIFCTYFTVYYFGSFVYRYFVYPIS